MGAPWGGNGGPRWASVVTRGEAKYYDSVTGSKGFAVSKSSKGMASPGNVFGRTATTLSVIIITVVIWSNNGAWIVDRPRSGR